MGKSERGRATNGTSSISKLSDCVSVCLVLTQGAGNAAVVRE